MSLLKKNQFLYIIPLILWMVVLLNLMNQCSMSNDILLEWVLSSNKELMWSMKMKLDLVSLSFLFMVSSISFMVIIYSFYYMYDEINFNKFILTLFMFILSMILMSTSSSLFWVIVGWDGLGASSFCLIIFFQNWKSYKSAMNTFMTNRLGDFFLISSIIWSSSFTSNFFIMLMIIITALTKSAQLPFSAWLPMAMAAPTPVSALVHSSTLVTAGIFLMMRFKQWTEIQSLTLMVLIISSMTSMFAGSSASSEVDFKKIIAFSTLSHLGMIIFFLSLNDLYPAIVHLLSHSFFKSLLFMVAGVFIHEVGSIQDIRSIYLNSNKTLWMIFSLSIFSMMGIPFLSGYMSKEMMILSIFMFSNKAMMFWISMFMVFFTCLYSSRMLSDLLKLKKSSLLLSLSSMNMKMLIPLFFGGGFSIFGVSFLVGVIFHSYYVCLLTINESNTKITLLIFMTFGITLGMKFNISKMLFSQFFLNSLALNFILSSPFFSLIKVTNKMLLFHDSTGSVEYFFLLLKMMFDLLFSQLKNLMMNLKLFMILSSISSIVLMMIYSFVSSGSMTLKMLSS